MTGWLAITLFVVSIIAAIMVHELGHLLTARWFGMRAERYFLGFGPTLWSTRRGETEYGVKALPLGGFVSIKGMSPLDERLRPVPEQIFDEAAVAADRERQAARAAVGAGGGGLPDTTFERLGDELRRRGASEELTDRLVHRTRVNLGSSTDLGLARSVLTEVVVGEVRETGRVGDLHHRILAGDRDRFFADRPAWERAIVLVAGSVMHFVIAALVLLGMYLFVPQPTGEVGPVVSEVVAGSPADEGGLQPGDRVVAVAGVASTDYDELREAIRTRPEQPTDFLVERGEAQLELTITPARAEDPATGEEVGQVGFLPSEVMQRLTVTEAIEAATVGPGGFVPLFTGSLEALGRVFSPEGLGNLFSQAAGEAERGVDGAVSLVGAASLAGQGSGTAYGLLILLSLIASVNVFIGIFNLVPLPPLDGGHLAVLGIERAVNAVRRARGQAADFSVDPRAVAAVAIPVLAVLGTVFVALLWLDLSNPIRLPG